MLADTARLLLTDTKLMEAIRTTGFTRQASLECREAKTIPFTKYGCWPIANTKSVLSCARYLLRQFFREDIG